MDTFDLILSYISDLSGPLPYMLIFMALIMCGLGIPMPEDIILITAGFVAYEGESNVYTMLVVGFIGILSGDSIIYFLGRRLGLRLLRLWPFRHIIPTEKVDLVKEKLHGHTFKVIFLARFMPGLRAPVYFTSGMLGIPFRTFFFIDALAAVISVPLIVILAYEFGEEIEQVIMQVRRVENGIVLAIIAVVAFFCREIFPKKTV